MRAREARRARAWFPVGLATGAAWIVKGSVLFLLPFLVLGAFRRPWRESAGLAVRGALAFVLGAALPVGPFAVRNVALGVPPLRMSSIEVAALIIYNSPNAATRQVWFDLESARRTADRCPVLSPPRALAAAIAAHPNPLAWARQSALRAFNLWRADDPWDDVRFSSLAPCLRSMRLAPVRWKMIEPLAVLGLVLAVLAWRRTAPLLGLVFLTLSMAALGVCLTRYRLNADHVHALLAAAAAVWLFREARARRKTAFLGAAFVLVVPFILHDEVAPPTPEAIVGYVVGTFSERTAGDLLRHLRP